MSLCTEPLYAHIHKNNTITPFQVVKHVFEKVNDTISLVRIQVKIVFNKKRRFRIIKLLIYKPLYINYKNNRNKTLRLFIYNYINHKTL